MSRSGGEAGGQAGGQASRLSYVGDPGAKNYYIRRGEGFNP